MSKSRKTRKALMFVIFIGFALIMRAIVDIFMGEVVNVQLAIAGVLIVAIGVYFSRQLMPNEER
ncbi:MAG: hypothetical protein GXP21_00195 [Gammaproteobacteria bacterium]|nr:hypothetical protein [Gammaproteobacteria bacterium]